MAALLSTEELGASDGAAQRAVKGAVEVKGAAELLAAAGCGCQN